jgi:hypothetical protein
MTFQLAVYLRLTLIVNQWSPQTIGFAANCSDRPVYATPALTASQPSALSISQP